MSDFFKNTFGKDDSERTLQYDNTAFLYFAISFLVTFSVVLVVSIVRQIARGDKSKKEYDLVKKDPIFKEVLKGVKPRLTSVYTSKSLLLKVGLLVLFVTASVGFYRKAQSSTNTLKGFDPYQLLGVEFDTPIPQIKKAYRKLALELHPDRNPNNPEAAAKFIFVSKAYECLTDEVAREACLKYGNPDGVESFNVGIALPSFLVQPQNQVFVMLAVFVILILVIPQVFLRWNNKFQVKDGRGVIVSNYYLLYRTLICDFSQIEIISTLSKMKEVEDPKLIKVIPKEAQEKGKEQEKEKEATKEIPKGKATHHVGHGDSCCDEEHEEEEVEGSDSQGQDHNHEEEQKPKKEMNEEEFLKFVENFKKSLKPVAQTQSSIKNLSALRKYINREDKFDKFLEEMPNLLRSLVYFSLDFCTRSSKKKKVLFPDQPELFIPFSQTLPLDQIIRMSKHFYQNNQSFPNGIYNLSLTPEEKEELSKEFNLQQVMGSEEDQQKLLAKIKPAEKRDTIKKEIAHLPHLTLDVSSRVDDVPETRFTERDIAQLKITLKKNPTSGVAFLPFYGYLKKERYYLSIETRNELMYFEEIEFHPGQTSHQTVYEYKQRDPTSLDFLVQVRSDCYFGLDVAKNATMTFEEYTGQQEISFHKEDLFVERAPKGYFEEMLTMVPDNPQDEELSDTADDESHEQIDESKPQAPEMHKEE